MLKADLPMLAAKLGDLSEVFGAKAVTPRALEIWFDALKDFPTERVMGVLIGWPKMNSRFPAPADVWKFCNEQAIKSREDVSEAHRRQNSGPASEYFAPSAEGARIIAEMKSALKRPRKPWAEYWQDVLNNPNSSHLQKTFARQSLRNLGVSQAEREPGQDDEEREYSEVEF
jgi:hypothetical protein